MIKPRGETTRILPQGQVKHGTVFADLLIYEEYGKTASTKAKEQGNPRWSKSFFLLTPRAAVEWSDGWQGMGLTHRGQVYIMQVCYDSCRIPMEPLTHIQYQVM
jgi:hypothetical protein